MYAVSSRASEPSDTQNRTPVTERSKILTPLPRIKRGLPRKMPNYSGPILCIQPEIASQVPGTVSRLWTEQLPVGKFSDAH